MSNISFKIDAVKLTGETEAVIEKLENTDKGFSITMKSPDGDFKHYINFAVENGHVVSNGAVLVAIANALGVETIDDDIIGLSIKVKYREGMFGTQLTSIKSI